MLWVQVLEIEERRDVRRARAVERVLLARRGILADRAREVRVIDENGEQLGVMAPFEALKMARERSLDLVEISPNLRPPLSCRKPSLIAYRPEQDIPPSLCHSRMQPCSLSRKGSRTSRRPLAAPGNRSDRPSWNAVAGA